ncbi:hypothetical protein D3C87_1792780 [compost metagenome]
MVGAVILQPLHVAAGETVFDDVQGTRGECLFDFPHEAMRLLEDQDVVDALADEIAAVMIIAGVLAAEERGITAAAREDEAGIRERRQNEIELIAGKGGPLSDLDFWRKVSCRHCVSRALMQSGLH